MIGDRAAERLVKGTFLFLNLGYEGEILISLIQAQFPIRADTLIASNFARDSDP